MKNISLLFFMFIFIIISCKDVFTKYGEQRMLNNLKSVVNDSIWIGLPEKINRKISVIDAYYPAILKYNVNYFGIFIAEKIDEEREIELLNHPKANEFFHFKMIDYESNDSVLSFTFKGSNKEIDDTIVAIFPDYTEESSPLRSYIEEKNWNTVILETKYGEYINEEYLQYSSSARKHGVSKGYFINCTADSVVYWLIGW